MHCIHSGPPTQSTNTSPTHLEDSLLCASLCREEQCPRASCCDHVLRFHRLIWTQNVCYATKLRRAENVRTRWGLKDEKRWTRSVDVAIVPTHVTYHFILIEFVLNLSGHNGEDRINYTSTSHSTRRTSFSVHSPPFNLTSHPQHVQTTIL